MPVLLNRVTGEAFEPDARAMRERRLKRRVRAWAQSVASRRLRQPAVEMLMVTLTLRPGVEWKPQMIRAFMLRTRARLGKALLAYAWVAELQRRGAVHYHVLLVVKRGARLPFPDKSGDWSHGSTRTERARKVWYIIKYAQKFEPNVVFPRGLRLFAVFLSENAVEAAERWRFRLSVLPVWAERIISEDYVMWSWSRIRGGFALAPSRGAEYEETIKTDWVYLRNLNLKDVQGLW